MIQMPFKTNLTLALLTVFCFNSLRAQRITTDQQLLEFGDVTIGDTVSLDVLIRNTRDFESVKLSLSLYSSSFSIDNALIDLEPGEEQTVRLKFHPTQNIAYRTYLLLNSEKTWSSVLGLEGDGRLSESYFSSTFNLWDSSLVVELKKLNEGARALSYRTARDYMYRYIDNVNGLVECAYTGRTARFETRAGANDNNFNCEHSWPRSALCANTYDRAEADIHHLFPTDVTANSKRGNFPFDTVKVSPSWSSGGSKLGNGVFEPRNQQKGRTARAMLYMRLIYGNCDGFLGARQEEILRQWSVTYQPSARERSRNGLIFKYQKNRNPFVDHPAFLNRIYSFNLNQKRPENGKLLQLDSTIKWHQTDSGCYSQISVWNRSQKTIVLDSLQFSGMKVNYSSDSIPAGEVLSYSLNAGEWRCEDAFNDSLSLFYSGSLDTVISIASSTRLSEKHRKKRRQTIYPNPTEGSISVPEQFESGQYQLFSLDGKLIQKGFIVGRQLEIREVNLSGLCVLKLTKGSLISHYQVLLR